MKKILVFVFATMLIFSLPVLVMADDDCDDCPKIRFLHKKVTGISGVLSRIKDLYNVDSFFDVFLKIKRKLRNLQQQIDEIELMPGPEGPQGPPGEPGPEGTCSCDISSEDFEDLVGRVKVLEGGGGPSEPTCEDGDMNGDETDVDCGGPCPPCEDHEGCLINGDCSSETCELEICKPIHCSNGVQDEDETSPDCGGLCSQWCPA